MPWGGYNFEDSILISEQLVKDDVFTSIHIEEFECVARDTKLGKEEITRDIPNVGEEALKDLDESGIIRIGAEVKPGDILVGKITPKGETQLSPEEKLLRAIFGEKAGDVRDTLAARAAGRRRHRHRRPGVRPQGHREGRARAGRSRTPRSAKLLKQPARRDQDHLATAYYSKMRELLGRQDHRGAPRRRQGQGPPRQGREARRRDARRGPAPATGTRSSSTRATARSRSSSSSSPTHARGRRQRRSRRSTREKIAKLKKGDELPPGVIKMVKVYVAIKRKLSVGDKMAGRHGNKGVVSRILPEEDMPYLEDGTPVDIVLNPLGVPSRMNIGQILEIHLGWAAQAASATRSTTYLDDQVVAATCCKSKLKKLFTDRAGSTSSSTSSTDEDVGRFADKLRTRRPHRDAGVRRRRRERDQGRAQDGRACRRAARAALRRQDRRAVRQRASPSA